MFVELFSAPTEITGDFRPTLKSVSYRIHGTGLFTYMKGEKWPAMNKGKWLGI